MSHRHHPIESETNVSLSFNSEDIRRLEEIQRKLSPGGRKVIALMISFFNREDGRLNPLKLMEFAQAAFAKSEAASDTLPALSSMLSAGSDSPFAELLQRLVKEIPAKNEPEVGQ